MYSTHVDRKRLVSNDLANRLPLRWTTDIQLWWSNVPRDNGANRSFQIVEHQDGYPTLLSVAWRRGRKVLDKLLHQTHLSPYPSLVSQIMWGNPFHLFAIGYNRRHISKGNSKIKYNLTNSQSSISSRQELIILHFPLKLNNYVNRHESSRCHRIQSNHCFESRTF